MSMPGIGIRLAIRCKNKCLNIHPLTWYLWPVKLEDEILISKKFLCLSWDTLK